MDEATGPQRRTHWEQRTATLLVVLGGVFIVAYSVVVLWPDAPPAVRALLIVLLGMVWVVFIAEVVARIVLTPRGQRWAFVLRHPVDVLSAVLPLFRALRVVSMLGEVPYLKRRSGTAVRTRIVVFALSYALMFVYFIALATLAAERDAPGATITSFGSAVWWAVVTIATVGYGDTYPITVPGRIYAVMLMVGGVAIVGTASATIISLINERIGQVRQRHDDEPPADGRV
ncbi:potassium channel family protein [Agromyces sp. H66]|uniref:potassium channel family protein n=1 Tax=Agromyces sp. H66 TaxID=2529859 RepID=UPI0010A9BD70|nr:potassium channel family protein [Agromyces sp. H66]